MTTTPEQIAKAAQFFDHIEGARNVGKGWWADALSKILDEQIARDRTIEGLLVALTALCGANVHYDGNEIHIPCDSHSDAIARMRIARHAVELAEQRLASTPPESAVRAPTEERSMSNDPTPTPDEIATKVADALSGTCGTLTAALAEFDAEHLEQNAEFCASLDDLVFLCDGCGWWCEQSEMVGYWSCEDCSGDDDEDGDE